jgi:peptide/nickel transport system ATP-binding protein
MSEDLLTVEGLTRHFSIGNALSRRTLHAVDDVSFTIGRREIVALAGESGSGKSTIARLLAGVYRPTAGTITYHGTRHIPMVFQDPFASLNPVFKVRHPILRALRLHRDDLAAGQRRTEAERVFDEVGLPAHKLDVFPHELSGGQRQRVGFAQAVATKPELIIADEPVSMLDVSIRIGLLNLMSALRDAEQTSILYITHDLASARYVADRLIVLYAGRIAEEGPIEQVLSEPRHPYTQLLVSSVPDPHAPLTELADAGEPPKVINPGPGCRFRWRCPLREQVCDTETPELINDVACHVANRKVEDETRGDRRWLYVQPRASGRPREAGSEGQRGSTRRP